MVASARQAITLPSPTAISLQDLPSQAAARSTLQAWLAEGEAGIGVLTGGPSSGRTRVLEQVVLWLAERDDRAIGFPQPPSGKRSDAGLLRESLVALGEEPAGRTGLDLTRTLRSLVQRLAADGMPPLLLLDDADLTGSQLEILGALFNGLDQHQEILPLQVLLAAPPEVLDRLQRRPRLAGLIRTSVHLDGLSADEVERLVDGWLAMARAADTTLPTLSNAARESILQVAGTNPAIAFDLLMTSMQAAHRMGTRRVGAGLTEAAAASLGGIRPEVTGRKAVDGATTLPLPGLDDGFQPVGEVGR